MAKDERPNVETPWERLARLTKEEYEKGEAPERSPRRRIRETDTPPPHKDARKDGSRSHKPEVRKESHSRDSGMTRRGVGNLLAGWGIAAGATGVVGGGAYLLSRPSREHRESHDAHPHAPSSEFAESINREALRNTPRMAEVLRSDRGMDDILTRHATTGEYLRDDFEAMGENVPSRIEYVSEHAMEFTQGRLSEVIRRELSTLIAAMPAQESQYDNDAQSTSGARLMFQFTDDRRDLMYAELQRRGSITYEDPEMRHLVTQVAAVGEYFVEIHRDLHLSKHAERVQNQGARESLLLLQQNYFPNDPEGFEQYFVVPVMINSYQAGEGTLIDAVNWFVYRYPTPASLGVNYPDGFGYDLFHIMTERVKSEADRRRRLRHRNRPVEHGQLDRYGQDSVSYVDGVYAYRNLFRDLVPAAEAVRERLRHGN